MDGGTEKLGLVHRIWFGAVFVVYVACLFLIPPFQSNDEDAHWMRMWSVARGHLTCAAIPLSAVELSRRFEEVRATSKMRRELLFPSPTPHGKPELVQASGAPCLYIPLSYLAPALAAKLAANPYRPRRPSRMLLAFYLARAVNLLLLAVGVYLFLRRAPALRNLTLLLYSLPMAIQQSVSINQESTILCLFFCVLLAWWARPSPKQVLLLLLAITLLALTKPTYLVFLLLWAAALLRLRPAATWQKLGLYALPVLVPFGCWAAWSYFYAGRPENLRFLPGWVNIPRQIEFVRTYPSILWNIVVTQFQDLLGRDHLRGGWVSVLGVLGWADYEIGERAYDALLVAVPIALFADIATHAGAAPVASRRSTYLLPALCGLLIIPAITITLYFQFNAPTAPYSMGMTGRYLHIPYFLVLSSIVLWARTGRLHRWLAQQARVRLALQACCALACLLAEHDTLRVIWTKYYASAT